MLFCFDFKMYLFTIEGRPLIMFIEDLMASFIVLGFPLYATLANGLAIKTKEYIADAQRLLHASYCIRDGKITNPLLVCNALGKINGMMKNIETRGRATARIPWVSVTAGFLARCS